MGTNWTELEGQLGHLRDAIETSRLFVHHKAEPELYSRLKQMEFDVDTWRVYAEHMANKWEEVDD